MCTEYLEIPLQNEDKGFIKLVKVKKECLLDGVLGIKDGMMMLGTLYATVGEEEPYLYVQQNLDADNFHTNWIGKGPTPFIDNSVLIEYKHIIGVADRLLYLFTDKVMLENLFKCNHHTRHKEPTGASCYYKIPLAQGIFNREDAEEGWKFHVTVYKPVAHFHQFHIKLTAIYPSDELEYCRVELRTIEETCAIIEGMEEVRYLGQPMHINDV